MRENPRKRLGVGQLQILEPYRYFSVNSGKRFSMGYVCKTAAYLPAAVEQSAQAASAYSLLLEGAC